MSGKKAKGVTGGEVGTVAELAGNMLTYGMTSDLTKGIGEKGINRIAKLTKTGETAEQALEKSKLVQKLSKGSPDRAKEISKNLQVVLQKITELIKQLVWHNPHLTQQRQSMRIRILLGQKNLLKIRRLTLLLAERWKWGLLFSRTVRRKKKL